MRIEAMRPLSGSSPDSPSHRELREVDGGCGCACEVAGHGQQSKVKGRMVSVRVAVCGTGALCVSQGPVLARLGNGGGRMERLRATTFQIALVRIGAQGEPPVLGLGRYQVTKITALLGAF
jgi:hypothetical protein